MPIAMPSVAMTVEEIIAFQAGKQRIDPDSYLRLSAYRQAMDECDLGVGEDWIHYSWSSPQKSQELAQRLAAQPPELRPQAFICHGLKQALYLMEAFAAYGQNVESATYLTQLQGKDYLTVWPAAPGNAKLVWPMSGWNK